MTDLRGLIDEYSPLIQESYISAVANTREEILERIAQATSENYPVDKPQLPQENGSDIFGLESLETQLSSDFEENLTALHDDSVILLLSVLGIRDFNYPGQLKIELIKSEIAEISHDTVKAVQSVGTNIKRILETIGLTPTQAKSLTTYRQALESVINGNDAISPTVTRNLSASQRSVLRKAINTGLDHKSIDKLVARQYKALLTHRAKAIGRNLASKVAHAAQQSTANFAANAGLINSNDYRRFWITAHDEKVRFSHDRTEAMNSQGVGIDQPFQTPFGPVMNPPLEINCRCHVAIKRVKK